MKTEALPWYLCQIGPEMREWHDLSDWEAGLVYFAAARHSPQDWLVWRPGWEKWRRLTEVQSLFASLPMQFPSPRLPLPK